jgi:hypothetical protein
MSGLGKMTAVLPAVGALTSIHQAATSAEPATMAVSAVFAAVCTLWSAGILLKEANLERKQGGAFDFFQ